MEQCPHCEKEFGVPATLRIHINAVHTANSKPENSQPKDSQPKEEKLSSRVANYFAFLTHKDSDQENKPETELQ